MAFTLPARQFKSFEHDINFMLKKIRSSRAGLLNVTQDMFLEETTEGEMLRSLVVYNWQAVGEKAKTLVNAHRSIPFPQEFKTMEDARHVYSHKHDTTDFAQEYRETRNVIDAYERVILQLQQSVISE